MTLKLNARGKAIVLVAAMLVLSLASTRMRADTGTCGGQMITLPFTDVPSANIFFCSIAEAYFSGLTNGTTPTTYSPSSNVSRDQMAAFITRTMDQSLRRGSRRAALDQFWTTQGADDFELIPVDSGPQLVKSDGLDIWVPCRDFSTVLRIRANDGSSLGSWNMNAPYGVLVARGMIFITGTTSPGSLYEIDPSAAPGGFTTLSTNLGNSPRGIAYDGHRIWTANFGAASPGSGSISIITLNPTTVTNVSTGFSQPSGLVFDGANIWVADAGDAQLKKLNSSGAILQSVNLDANPRNPAFDGTNIWVPNQGSNSVTVVRALTGVVLSTLTGNGLSFPFQAAFDGERILVTNEFGDSISLWKATDLSPIANFSTGASTHPTGVCSDGVNFWISLNLVAKLVRF